MDNYSIFRSDEAGEVENDCKLVSPEDFSEEMQDISGFSSFSLLNFNIKSCRKNFALFQVFISSLVVEFSVIVFNETWLSPGSDVLFDLNGYSEYNQYRGDHGGGIKFYVRDMIDVSLIEDLCFTMDLFECLTCRLIVAGVHYILCCIYRPPQSSVNNFLTYLRDNILSRFSKNSKIILVGDININLLNPLKNYLNF